MTEIKHEKYVSCEWLESGVCFDNGVYGSNVKLCCYMSAPGGGNTMLIENYHGEKINWDKFFEKKREYREIQKSGKTVDGCRGCIFLKERYWPQVDYIDSIIFDHFTRCNCNCSYCYTNENKKMYNSLKTYNIYPIVKDMFKKHIIKRGGAIGFGGGEPVILPEFDKLLDLFIKNGFTNIRVPSSGIKYSKTLEKGIATGQVTVLISIDSASRNTYRIIKRTDAYEIVKNNLIKYAKAQKQGCYNVSSKYIIVPYVNDTKDELDNWLMFNKDNNIELLVLDIENSWLTKFREEGVHENILELIRYVSKRAEEIGFHKYELCDRARYLID